MKKLTLALAVVPMLAALCACAPPAPGKHERLVISERGEYSLGGKPVAGDRLQQVLVQERQRQPDLFAEISASPKADIQAIRHAVSALQSAQVRFAFVDEQLMGGRKQQGTPAE